MTRRAFASSFLSDLLSLSLVRPQPSVFRAHALWPPTPRRPLVLFSWTGHLHDLRRRAPIAITWKLHHRARLENDQRQLRRDTEREQRLVLLRTQERSFRAELHPPGPGDARRPSYCLASDQQVLNLRVVEDQ